MLDYNTQTRQLALPEYGRNIQQMVDFCVTIPDREERTRCAYTIIDVMRNLMTDNNNQDENLKKYWDHLNIMADFKLDIDFPYEVISKEELNPVPNRIPYNTTSIRYRHYGKNIEHMINRVAELENSDDKELLISFIAHLTSDKVQFVKLYPEGNAETRFQLRGRGYIYIYCNKHGLLKKKI